MEGKGGAGGLESGGREGERQRKKRWKEDGAEPHDLEKRKEARVS